mgnify:CR=1 FL=1
MNLSELLNVTSGVVINNMKSDKTFDKISINSKEVQKNSLFIALKGKNHDSHDYLEEVIKKRPTFILVEKDISIKTKIPILLINPLLHDYDILRLKDAVKGYYNTKNDPIKRKTALSQQ